MPFTPQQLDAINDNSNTLLVSAAAGSGKTSVLVQRILRMLTVDKLDIRRILVLTFTKAAASQLKEKLQDSLFEACKTDKSLQTQLDNVSSSHIETLHSFCSKLIHTEFVVANIDPHVKPAPDSLRERLFNESINTTLDYCYQNPTEQMQHLIDVYTEVDLIEMLNSMYKTIMS